MGGSSLQGDQGPTGLGTMNPLVGVFNNLFGTPTRADVAGGGIMLGSAPYQGAGFGYANPIFSQSDFDVLGGILQPTDLQGMGVDIPGLINQTALGQQELAQTGYKTDISPAVELSRRLFEEEFIPGAMEQFGGLGLNPGDTDFTNAVMREGSRRATELGALGLDLSEAAANRRMAGMQAAPGILDLQNLGLAADFAQTDAGQLLNRLTSIGSMNTQAGGVGGGGSENRKGGGILFG